MIKFLGHLSCILDSLRMVYNFCFNVTSPLPIFFFLIYFVHVFVQTCCVLCIVLLIWLLFTYFLAYLIFDMCCGHIRQAFLLVLC